MKFNVTIYQDEDGMFIAECPSIPGCISQGRTEEEAQKNIQDAIKECLIVRKDLGLPPIISTRVVEVAL
jgi:predicted RNase H-like HicB family nuclease